MAITGVLRPGFVQIRVLDMEASIVHYRDRLGLLEIGREADGRVYFHAMDDFDRHCVILREADTPGMDCMGFKVQSDADLDNFEKRLKDMGVETSIIPAGEQPGLGRRVSFVAPTGHRFDLFAHMDPCENPPQTKNPDIYQFEPRGMGVSRFDHCLLYGDDLDGTVKIFTEVLDFRITEKISTPEGVVVGAFLACSTKAHDVAIIRHEEKNKFHHASFYLEDWAEVGRAADIIARYDMALDIGPTRHGITRGKTIYFFDPSGNRNEVFTGGYIYYPDHPVREWDASELGKGIFYYERKLNERFLSVLT